MGVKIEILKSLENLPSLFASDIGDEAVVLIYFSSYFKGDYYHD